MFSRKKQYRDNCAEPWEKTAAYKDVNAHVRCGKTPNKHTNGNKLSIFISFVYHLQYSTIPNLTL